ncbi:MAG: hypothetical protein AAF449_23530, partial [Myxococcota bacterium]
MRCPVGFWSLGLLSVALMGACTRKDERSNLVPAPIPIWMGSLAVDGDKWTAVGTRGAGRDARVVLMTGTSTRHESSALIDRPGYTSRDLATFGERLMVVGAHATEAGGALGHPLYEAYAMQLGEGAQIEKLSVRGEPGTTSWRSVRSLDDGWVFAGSDNGRSWVLCQTSTATRWEHRWPDIDRIHGIAAVGQGPDALFGLLGEKGPITRGQAIFRAVDASGRVRWSWSAASSAQLTIVERLPGYGWALAGHDQGRGFIVAIDKGGEPRWQWRAPTRQDAGASSASSRVSALAANTAGRLLVTLAHPFAMGDASRPTLLILSSESMSSAKTESDQPIRLGASGTRAQIWKAASLPQG